MKKKTLPTKASGDGITVTLPPSISEILKKHSWPTQAEMLAVRDWFAAYFTQTFRTFDRKTVGRRISPADELMQHALGALHLIAPCLPKGEREGVFIPLNVLLKAIAERWDDAAAPALGALQHVHELENVVMVKTDRVHQWAKSGAIDTDDELHKRAQAVLDEYAKERNELKAELGKLSAQLLQGNTDELKETLAQVKADICAAVFNTAEKTQCTVEEESKRICAKVRRRKDYTGSKKLKQIQRERAAQWLIKKRAEGEKASIVDAAQEYGNEIKAERSQGGYKNVENLRKDLYTFAEQLGIKQFVESGKRGRPRKR